MTVAVFDVLDVVVRCPCGIAFAAVELVPLDGDLSDDHGAGILPKVASQVR